MNFLSFHDRDRYCRHNDEETLLKLQSQPHQNQIRYICQMCKQLIFKPVGWQHQLQQPPPHNTPQHQYQPNSQRSPTQPSHLTPSVYQPPDQESYSDSSSSCDHDDYSNLMLYPVMPGPDDEFQLYTCRICGGAVYKKIKKGGDDDGPLEAHMSKKFENRWN